MVGTAEKTEFIDCAPVGNGNYDCSVFDSSGVPFAIGYFRLSSGDFDPRDPREYLGFDGHQIRLTRGRRLELREPPRPPGVPASAQWGDNPLCGTYVDCQHSVGPQYICTVYNERSGALITNGTFLLQGGGSVARPRAMCDVASSGRIVVDGGYLQRTP